MASPTQNPQDQQATVYPEFAHLLLASPSLSSSTPSSLQNSTSRPRERRYGQILPSTFSVLEHTPPARPSNNPYIEPAASPSPIESPVLHIPGAFHLTPQPQPQPAPETPQLPELDENYSTPASPDSDLAPLLPHEISAFAGPSTAVHATQQQHHQHQESDQDQQQHLGHSKTHRKAIQRRSAPDAGRLGADTPHPAGQLRRHSYHPHPDPVQDPVYQASAAGTGELELHGPVARCCSLSASRGRVTPGPASTPALDPAPSSSNPAQTPAPAPAPPTSNPPPAQTPAPTPPNPTPPSRPPPQLTPYPYPDNRRIPHAITGQRPRPFHAYPPPVVATNPRYPVERGTERTASLRLACLSAPPEAVEEDVGDYTHFSGERTQMVRPSPRPRSARFTEEMGLDGPACFAVYGSEGEEDLDWRNVPMRRLPDNLAGITFHSNIPISAISAMSTLNVRPARGAARGTPGVNSSETSIGTGRTSLEVLLDRGEEKERRAEKSRSRYIKLRVFAFKVGQGVRRVIRVCKTKVARGFGKLATGR